MGEETLFDAALAIPNPSDRARFLDRACAGNPGLRREVEALLAGHAADNPLDRRPVDVGRTGPYESDEDGPPPAAVGERIGPYRLMEQIGEGGFGLVFVAEQNEPVRRKVALKVLKPGMDTKDVVARFEAERQALALMDHPNIARVFDAGATSQGRPYFVMELVRGVPITDYCDEHKLPTRDRLALFVQVCQAVQHAHQKGIIHRDLKPSNILVAPHDGVPVVKVIDFGVAKALGQSLTEKTIYTRFAQMIGTPLYMSPEQAEVNQLDVDTRADVYALGVLLYELLTGTTPFDKDRFKRAAFDEIRRIIKEEEPPRPSTRLTSLGETLSAAAANRQIDAGKLAGLVRGELDWIVMKALEKDRGRRYETANGFAADVNRYLAGEPVLAVPPSTGYRVRKFVRKNRVPVLAASAAVAVLLAGVAGTTAWMFQARQLAREAKDEAARTKAALRLAGERYVLAGEAADAFLSAITEDEQLKEGDNVELRRKLLTDAVPLLKRMTEDDPADDRQKLALALAHKRVGDISSNELQDYAAGRKSLETAESILEALVRDRPDEPEYRVMLGRVQNNLAVAMESLRDPTAEGVYAKSRQAFTDLAERYPDKPEYQLYWAGCLSNYANDLRGKGKLDESRKVYEQVIRIATPLAEKDTKDPRYMETVARAYQYMAPTLPVRSGRGGEGRLVREGAYRTAIQWWDRVLVHHPRRSGARSAKAFVCRDLATQPEMKPEEAIGLFRQVLSEYEWLADNFPGRTGYRMAVATAQVDIALSLGWAGQRAEADRLFAAGMARAAEEVARRPTRDNRWSEATTHVNHSRYLAQKGDKEGQKTELLAAVDRYERMVKDLPGDVVIRRILAETLLETATALDGGNSTERDRALDLLDRAVRVLEPLRAAGTIDPRVATLAIVASTSRITALGARDRYTDVLAEYDRYTTWLTAGAAVSELAAFYRAKALIRTGRADAGLEGYEAAVRAAGPQPGAGVSARRWPELTRAGLYALAHAATGKAAYADKAVAIIKSEADARRTEFESRSKGSTYGSFTIPPNNTIVRSLTDPAFDSVRKRNDFSRAEADWNASFATTKQFGGSLTRTLEAALVMIRNGDHAGGTSRVKRFLERGTPDGPGCYAAAGVYALAAGQVPDDAAQREQYARRAVEILKLAVENGWNDPDHAAKNADLDAIRGREDYKEVMQLLIERKKGGPETAPSPRAKK